MCSEGQQIHVWCSPDTSLSARKGQEDLPVFPVYVQLPFQLTESLPYRVFWCWFSCGDPKICCHKKGRPSSARFVLQRKGGSFSSSPVPVDLVGRALLSAQLSSQYSCPLPKPHRWNWHREFWAGTSPCCSDTLKKLRFFWVTGSSPDSVKALDDPDNLEISAPSFPHSQDNRTGVVTLKEKEFQGQEYQAAFSQEPQIVWPRLGEQLWFYL